MTGPPSVLHAAVSDVRLLAVAAVVALLEGALRLAIAVSVDPVAAVLCPPVVAVVGLAWAVPAARAAMDRTRGAPAIGGSIRSRLLSLAAVAVGGHALAVGLGAALFLLVDTPIRFALYGLGYGDLLAPTVIAVSPLFGVIAGTLVAWAVPAVAAVRVADGGSAVDGLRETVHAVVHTPRAVARSLAYHSAIVYLVGATILLVGLGVTLRVQPSFEGFVVLFALVGLLAVFGTTLLLAVSVTYTATHLVSSRIDSSELNPSAAERSSSDRGPPSVPVTRLAVAALLVTSLVATAGVVRTGEVRPMDTEPEPLPDGPDDLYATALENTERSNYEYRYVDLTGTDGDGDEPDQVIRRDRADRQFVSSRDGLAPSYGSMGTFAPVSSTAPDVTLRTWEPTDDRPFEFGAMPGYPYFATERSHTEPAPAAEGWSVADATDDELVLELSDPTDVYAALNAGESAVDVDEPRESWATVTVDTETKTVSSAEFRLDATVVADGTAREYDVHTRHEYEIGIDVERPSEYGSPSASEWLWKLFAY